MNRVVTVTSLKSANRRGMGRPYLAQLLPSPSGSIERRFAPRVKGSSNGTICFEFSARPGDVFEARRFLWDMDRQQYYGGKAWFGIDENHRIIPLSRDEALTAIGATLLPRYQPSEVGAVEATYATRIVPDGISIGEVHNRSGAITHSGAMLPLPEEPN